MANEYAIPSCSIEVYPFEGGPYEIQGGQIRSVTVEKNLYGGSVGTVSVQLANGGPDGPESIPTWTQVITPMSHILVGMTRGPRSAIVLDGIVTRTAEAEEWQASDQGSFTIRAPTIMGADFAWFFNAFNWYSLTFMGMGAGTAWGNALGLASAGLPALLNQGTQGGISPTATANAWYSSVMAGSGAIMGKTFIPFRNSTRIPFGTAVATAWEEYPGLIIPYSDNFMAAEESWMAKFTKILPMPWYEFFVTTAAPGEYVSPLMRAKGPPAAAILTGGTVFNMPTQPQAPPAGPVLVARLNPTPTLGATADQSSNKSALTEMDMRRWNALKLNQPDAGFYSSQLTYDSESARNFYQLNPTAAALLWGVNNANNIPFPFSNMGAADAASVQRYGFRPEIGSFRWLYDPRGVSAQNSEVNFSETVAVLLARLISTRHPMVLMGSAAAVFPLMPDVRVGTRFRYFPFKGEPSWDFYIEGVKHNFVFGGTSTTSLSLGRGLPTTIYQDASTNGLLRNIHLGNAMRAFGDYRLGLPSGSGPPLTTFGTPESIAAMAGNLAQIFVTPQPAGY